MTLLLMPTTIKDDLKEKRLSLLLSLRVWGMYLSYKILALSIVIIEEKDEPSLIIISETRIIKLPSLLLLNDEML